MWVKKRHAITYVLLRPSFRLVLRILFGFSAIKYKLPKGPHLIISNHQTTMDPFMMALSFRRPIYFMASKDLFTKKPYSKLMKFLVAPIPKSKSESDLNAIKLCLQIAKEGGTVALFPEGNRSYSGHLWHIDTSIVKLAKKLKIPLVIYNLKGGYGIEARWSNHLSKGRMTGEVVDVMSVDEVNAMSNEDLFAHIKDKLTVIESPSVVPFHSKKSAEKLERVLYICPNCGSFESIHTDKQWIMCHQCDLRVMYTPHLTFDGNIKFNTVHDWYVFQEQTMAKRNIDKHFTFSDKDVTLYEIVHGKKRIVHIVGNMVMNREGITFSNESDILNFLLKDIRTITVIGKHKIDFYIGNTTYQVIGKEDYNPLKYWQLFYRIQGEKL